MNMGTIMRDSQFSRIDHKRFIACAGMTGRRKVDSGSPVFTPGKPSLLNVDSFSVAPGASLSKVKVRSNGCLAAHFQEPRLHSEFPKTTKKHSRHAQQLPEVRSRRRSRSLRRPISLRSTPNPRKTRPESCSEQLIDPSVRQPLFELGHMTL